MSVRAKITEALEAAKGGNVSISASPGFFEAAYLLLAKEGKAPPGQTLETARELDRAVGTPMSALTRN